MSKQTLPPAKMRLESFLTENPHYAKRSLGQNFLVNDIVIRKMLDKLETFQPQLIVEVGPGPGALTDYLLNIENIRLHLIEYDSHLASVWKSRGAELTEADALQFDWRIFASENSKVFISNLPYQISSSIVIERCFDSSLFQAMILMFQKEVADRLRAQTRTVDYGLLTVVAQTFWEIEMLAGLGTVDFVPPPKVNSQVLTFRSRQLQLPEFLKLPEQRKKYMKFVKMSFQQRRKYLKSNLRAGFSPEAIDAAFLKLAISTQVRAEEITVAQFQLLFEILSQDAHHSR